ncbi:conserved hypothetical protein [Hahella chejuensis KCTC 2396]|uniref:Uncharacterized protein n=1 Tax=Hahella chejuensis (strain KCTC 2396) TaxID=349521 RepID=Q2SQJ2_HAHCH|nr:hypothetical protein [Hahella chejuensis]ABC27082.1 conserved hypothetical protein [Hahella chejuensis KCTC 2396]
MQKLTSFLFAFLACAGIFVQVFVSWYWMNTDAPKQFLDFFNSLYGAAPAWSQWAFAFKQSSWWPPLLCAALLIFAIVKRPTQRLLGAVAGVSLSVAGGLVYAMYPLHLMLQSPV